jgi:hypothetical protein
MIWRMTQLRDELNKLYGSWSSDGIQGSHNTKTRTLGIDHVLAKVVWLNPMYTVDDDKVKCVDWHVDCTFSGHRDAIRSGQFLVTESHTVRDCIHLAQDRADAVLAKFTVYYNLGIKENHTIKVCEEVSPLTLRQALTQYLLLANKCGYKSAAAQQFIVTHRGRLGKEFVELAATAALLGLHELDCT